MIAATSLVMLATENRGISKVVPALLGMVVVGEGCEGGSVMMLNLVMLVMLAMRGMRRSSTEHSLTVLVLVKIE